MTSFHYSPENDDLDRRAPVLVLPPPPREKLSGWRLWRARLFLAEFILVCMLIGIILIAFPWTPVWTNNSLLIGFPRLREALMSDFVRGLISGLGLIDIWLAISEAIHYRESN
jgi:hypothetical protein